MIDRKIIDSYKEIKAPAELKQRVMEKCSMKKQKNNVAKMRYLSLVAACFVVVCCLFAFGLFDKQVEINVDTLPMYISSVREGAPIISFVTIEYKGEIRIKTESNGFYVADNDKNIVSKLNKEYVSEDKIIIGWTGENGLSSFEVNGIEYDIIRMKNEIKVNKK